MIKFKRGFISNMEGESKDIVVNTLLPNKVKDIVIGVTLVGVGITYLTVKAFENGASHFEEAEYQVMKDLGLIHD